MKNLLFIYAAILLMNCASSNFASTNDSRYAEYKGAVKVFFENPEEIEYEQIGIIGVESSLFSNDVQMIKRMQKKAGKEGANAIIIISAFSGTKINTQENDDGVYISGNDGGKMLAIAIRIRE